jgi:glycerate 2-kinase
MAERADLAALLKAWFRETIARLDPAERVAAALAREPIAEERVVLLSAGKAAVPMARGAIRALGRRVTRGLVVTPEGPDGQEVPPGLEHMVAAHPVPDERSERAGRGALALVAGTESSERVLALISGGASALLCVPAPGLSRAEKVAATSAVMAAGAPIEALNTLRKHLSAIKGGRLAAASPAPLTTLAASDVVGDALTAIASGPTVPDPTTFENAWQAVEQSCGSAALPAAVRAHLLAGRRGERDESPSVNRWGDRAQIIAGTGALVDEAVTVARAHGAEARELARGVEGDVALVAALLARAARQAVELASATSRLVCLVAGGEPTVKLLAAPGEGGRAHQLALLVAERLAGIEGVAVLVAGSDGIDGNARGAGAIVTGTTWDAIGAAGLDPRAALASCDAAPSLAAASAQLITGPTGVNHADLMLVVAMP